jgi:formylglycine-generating enzyme required for sulfatase activity
MGRPGSDAAGGGATQSPGIPHLALDPWDPAVHAAAAPPSLVGSVPRCAPAWTGPAVGDRTPEAGVVVPGAVRGRRGRVLGPLAATQRGIAASGDAPVARSARRVNPGLTARRGPLVVPGPPLAASRGVSGRPGVGRLLALAGVIAVVSAPGGTALAQRASPGVSEAMVAIGAGSYPIGSDDGREDERPAHRVVLDAFRIDRHEVTNVEFVAFLEAVLARRDVRLVGEAAPGTVDARVLRGADAVLLMERTDAPDRRTLVALNDADSRIGIRQGRLVVQPGFERHPVNEVTWSGARAYCAWRGARLPTEAEWEAAARGRDGRRYPWGDAPPTAARAVFGRRSNETEPVGSRPAGATPEGVHDLAGNVAEWTSTLYRPYPYRRDDGREDPEAPGERVTRGGDHVFDSAPEALRAAFRAGFSRATDVGHRHIGFRCAR